jgi:hypothetical protein
MDVEVIGGLLDRFNREFDEPSPGLAVRLVVLMASGDTDVVLGGGGPGGLPWSGSDPRSGRRGTSFTWSSCT